jgi:SAM-dependent methyltransferase
MTDTLIGYRAVWKQKAVLRILCNDIFERIAGSVVDGTTLELGEGIGNLKEKIASLISSDIQFAPWLDLVADAQKLPFAVNSLSNIVMLDVLHHIEFPSLLFSEAVRVLRPGEQSEVRRQWLSRTPGISIYVTRPENCGHWPGLRWVAGRGCVRARRMPGRGF